MSIQAKLHVGDRVFNVLECHFSFKKAQDSMGRPSGHTLFRGVNLVIEGTKDNLFWEWAISPTERKQAELHFTPRLLGTKTRKLQLIDAYCVEHRVNFLNHSATPVTEMVKLTCGGFKDSNFEVEYSAHWRETFPMPNDVEVTTIQHDNPQIVSCRYTDRDGNPITELYEDTLILEVETTDCVGKTVNIDLSDDEFNFKYQGKLLKNDILRGLKITADKQKVELEVEDEV